MRNLLKPSLSTEILSINNFTTTLLSELLSDFYLGYHLKIKKVFKKVLRSLVVKLLIDISFHKRLSFIGKYCRLLTSLPNFLVSTKFTNKFDT